MRLEGRNALVTGGGSGIGQAISVLFAKEGANVAVNDLTEERTKDTVSMVRKERVKTFGIGGDVSDFTSMKNVVDRTIAEFGKLDTLICNAGIAPTVELANMTPAQWDKMIRVHLNGVFNCCRAAINHMIENGFGRIVITSSSSGIQGDALLVHYCAAKAGQIGFAKALSREVVDKGITVNVVAPGLTKTPIQAEVDQSVIERYIAPIGRWGMPNDQAWAFVYLASDEAEYVTGQVISPNGGAL